MIFGKIRQNWNYTMAVNVPLQEKFGDIDRVNPELRRYAIALLVDGGDKDKTFVSGMGRIFANIIASLYFNRDCNEIDPEQWAKLGDLYRSFGDVMVELGEVPRLTWPSYDAQNAPDWASLADD